MFAEVVVDVQRSDRTIEGEEMQVQCKGSM